MRRSVRLIGTLALVAGAAGLATSPASALQRSLQFNGTNQYVTFGPGQGITSPTPDSLGVKTFTIECWFKRTGTGATTTTGSGMRPSVPLVSKGRGEADNSNVDCNFFLGINVLQNTLFADYEEGSGQSSPGLNRPIAGVTPVTMNAWHHAAVTLGIEGANLRYRLYLDGAIDKDTLLTGTNHLPRWDSVQHAGLATAMQSNGTPDGWFAGRIDEVRVWDHARTGIADSMSLEIPAAAGLLGRWSLDEGSGTLAFNSADTHDNGVLVNGPVWSDDSPFAVPTPPAAPTGLAASSPYWHQTVLAWTDVATDESSYEVERSTAGGPFAPLATLAANAVGYTDNGLEAGTEYCYRVRAVNGAGPSEWAGPQCATTPALTCGSLDFAGSGTYARFPGTGALQLSAFTLETWFRRDGAGQGTDTGSGGMADLIPLIAKGRAEAEDPARDIDYIFGIRAGSGRLAADFEQLGGDTASLNHPVEGATVVTSGVWHHGAVTYDGQTWKLYLDGTLDRTFQLAKAYTPATACTISVAIAAALNSTGVAGAFDGVLDEVRVWNVARTQAEIQSTINAQIASPQPGLVGRWALDEKAGTTLFASAGTAVPGALIGTAYSRASECAPFDWSPPAPPAAPTSLVATSAGSAGVHLAWVDQSSDETRFEVERSTSGSGGPFVPLATVGANVTTYDDGGLTPSTEYCYQVRAANAAGASAYATPACATTQPPSPPNPPTGLAATPISQSRIDLSWTDASSDELSFSIERSTTGSGGPFSPLATVGAGVTTYSDASLTPSAEYCYRVQATNAIGGSAFAGPVCASTPAFTNMALDFAGSTYVTFGDPAALDLAQFTVECWFKRDSTGTSSTTGTGGIPDAVPLVAHGAPQSEGGNVDMNFMLGFTSGTGLLCADFEEGTGGTGPVGLNHPISGRTPVGSGWHHAAATYDGSTWKLYLDGILDAATDINQPACSTTLQQASLATMLTSTGGTNGFFAGRLDEVRIWNYARSQAEIRSTANAQIASPQPGLVARWGLDEGSGTAVGSSAGTSVNGTITGPNYSWVTPGGSFDLTFNEPPLVPVVMAPANGGIGVSTSPSLDVSVTDPEGAPLTVTYFGRALNASAGPDFTLAVLPDAQYYTAQTNGGSIATLDAQNNWVIANRVARNIAYTVQLGDCTDTNTLAEWSRASSSFGLLENPGTTGLPQGMPYGVSVGNHDQSPNGDPTGTANYNATFGESRFSGRTYYGGHYGADNDNWYETFSASGMDFIVVSLEYDPSMTAASPSLQWADALLTSNSNRRAIVVSHFIVNTGNPAGFGPQGQTIYNALKGHSNLFLMLCGHVPGEGRRQDAFNGTTVHTLLADYQSRTAGGNGWMRILEFSPANDVIRVRTYSPTLGQFEADADSSSQFTLAYPMQSLLPFQMLGTANVASGSVASLPWAGLSASTQYEWYTQVSDGNATTTSPVWRFTTATGAQYTLDVTASPPGGGTVAKSPDQATYAEGSVVRLTATPGPGYAFSKWSGDASGTGNPIDVTMSANRTIVAEFTPTTLSTVSAGSPVEGVTVGRSVVGVPVRITRSVATPILGFSVDFTVSSNLIATAGEVHEGTFLSAVNPTTSFNVVDHGGGHFTADGATLGAPCGATALDGLLFTVEVGSGAVGGTGTVSIEAAHLRDCGNDSLPAAAGSAASVSIDRSVPAVTVSAPNGAEFWVAGSSHDLTWSATDAEGVAADGVDLDYTIDGTSWVAIATQLANGGSYAWTLPATVSATARVRVTVRDVHGNAGLDMSDAAFTIAGVTASTLAVEPDPGIYLEPVTLSATVTPAAASGAVEFFDGSTSLGSAPLASGVATLAVSTLAVGSHDLSATYHGDALHAASSAAVVTREVKARIVASAGAGGSISPSGTVLVSLNATPSFAFAAEPGYHPASLTVDGGAVAVSSPYTFAPVSANHTLDVQFVVNPPVAPLAQLDAYPAPATDGDGTLGLRVHWDDVLPVGTTVEVYRARFGGHPRYDEAGGSEPLAPASPPAEGGRWERTAVQASDQLDELNGTAARDVWFYVAYVRDLYGSYSPPSNVTVGRPNYRLGDVSDGTTVGVGNNLVDMADISALGASYGLSGPATVPVAYLDVGPTQDYSVGTRPRTDMTIDFEDLVMFALNFQSGPTPPALVTRLQSAKGAASGAAKTLATDRLRIEAPEPGAVGEEFEVRLHLQGSGEVKALSVALRWNGDRVVPLSVRTGAWLVELGGLLLSPRPGVADLALPGAGAAGFGGEGEIAIVRFRTLAVGDPELGIERLLARDAANHPLQVATEIQVVAAPRPTFSALSRAFPNPFRQSTTLGLSLAEAGPVSVAIFGVDGRCVRTLASGTFAAGPQRLEWDGRNDHGQAVPAGIYFVRMNAGGHQLIQRIACIR